MFSHLSLRTRITFWALLGVACAIFVGLYVASPNQDELNLQLAKSLIQFIVILFLGALVADFFKRIDRQRGEEEHLALFREDVRKRLGDCYQHAKKIRSQLRAAGITPQHCDSTTPMVQSAIEAYRCQSEQLNEVQLDLEKLWSEVDCYRCAFTHDEEIVRRIRVMSGFLRKVVDEYEENWRNLASRPSDGPPPQLQNLGHLVGTSTKGWFREKYCDRYSEAVDFIRRDDLRAPTQDVS